MPAIWATIVIVAILSIALVVYIVLLASQVEPDRESIEVSFDTPKAKAKFINGEDYWDVTSEVKKVETDNDKVQWVEVRVTIRSEDDRVLLANARIKPNDPSAYDDGSDGWVDVQVWYICTPAHEPRVFAGHTIKVTGITKDFEGGTVVISKAMEDIGSFTIPPLTV